jgi:hypothetical protein
MGVICSRSIVDEAAGGGIQLVEVAVALKMVHSMGHYHPKERMADNPVGEICERVAEV